MKNMLGVCIAGILLAAPVASGAKNDKPSVISAYSGKYKGTVLASGFGEGTTRGNFSASAKKDNGTLSLRSTLPAVNLLLTEKFAIKGRKFTYKITVTGVSSTIGTGFGKAKVLRNSIRLTGTAIINGDVFVLDGTVKKSKKRLNVTSNVIGSGGVMLTYTLKKKGK